MFFRIEKIQMSESKNRNESNGILFFNRYRDGDNLYYAGMRVDGHPVIKKKSKGTYYTLSYPPAQYEDGTAYHKTEKPNLLPEQKWIGMRVTCEDTESGVQIRLYLNKRPGHEKWQFAAEAIDDGSVGGPPFLDPGFGGIRTDFMDVAFRAYRVKEIER
jgi:hypothetical protein